MKKREMEKKLRLAEDALENVEFLAAQSGNCSAQRLIDKIDGVLDDYKRAVRQVDENVRPDAGREKGLPT